MTAAGLSNLSELDPIRDLGWELLAGPAGRLPSEAELIDLLPGVDGWVAGVEPVSARALAAADCLTVISRNGVGADAIDVEAAAALGIDVVLARGANSRGVAELALTLILSCVRNVPASNASLHAGGWDRQLGREMPDICLGIVGFGAIGRLVATLASAMGSRVLAFDPFAPADPASHAEPASLEEIFAQCDVITLHSPPAADGSPLVTGELLARCRPGTILINTARSALIDDAAVLASLNSGLLNAYAVDAFDSEPPVVTTLLSHDRTVMTPHLGGFTAASTRRASQLAVENLIANLETRSFLV